MRNLEVYISWMLEIIWNIKEFTFGLDYNKFVSNKAVYHATVSMTIQLWETAVQIANHYPSFQFTDQKILIRTRNVLVHTYYKIDPEVIRKIVKNHIPELKSELLKK